MFYSGDCGCQRFGQALPNYVPATQINRKVDPSPQGPVMDGQILTRNIRALLAKFDSSFESFLATTNNAGVNPSIQGGAVGEQVFTDNIPAPPPSHFNTSPTTQRNVVVNNPSMQGEAVGEQVFIDNITATPPSHFNTSPTTQGNVVVNPTIQNEAVGEQVFTDNVPAPLPSHFITSPTTHLKVDPSHQGTVMDGQILTSNIRALLAKFDSSIVSFLATQINTGANPLIQEAVGEQVFTDNIPAPPPSHFDKSPTSQRNVVVNPSMQGVGEQVFTDNITAPPPFHFNTPPPTTQRNVVVNPIIRKEAVGEQVFTDNISAPPPSKFNTTPTTQRNVVVNPSMQGVGEQVFTDNITAPPPFHFNTPPPTTQRNVVVNPSMQGVGEQVFTDNIPAPPPFHFNTTPTTQRNVVVNFSYPSTYQMGSTEEYNKNLMPSNIFGSSYIPHQGCKCNEMRSHAQKLSKQSDLESDWNRMPSSIPRYNDPQHKGAKGNLDHSVAERTKPNTQHKGAKRNMNHSVAERAKPNTQHKGANGNTDHSVAERTKPMRKRTYKCNFCINNKDEDIFHKLKSKTGEVLCPILREVVCKICGATQANAHTPKNCPQNRRNLRDLTLESHLTPIPEINS